MTPVDPIPWLLEAENPPIRTWTLRDLLLRPADDPEVQAARAAIPSLAPQDQICSKTRNIILVPMEHLKAGYPFNRARGRFPDWC